MKGDRVPHGRLVELQKTVGQLMVNGARNQPGERAWIVTKIQLPDILGEPHNTCFIFQRVHHRLECATNIRQESEPFGMAFFRFVFFRHVDDDDGAVHGGCLPKDQLSAGSGRFCSCTLGWNDPASTASETTQAWLGSEILTSSPP